MDRRRPSCSDSLPRSEAQIRLCPEKFDESSANDGPKLAPVDGGFQAWMFLAACVMIEALIWGESARVTTRWQSTNYEQDLLFHSESSRNTTTTMKPSRTLAW